jgi:hypothetical protein
MFKTHELQPRKLGLCLSEIPRGFLYSAYEYEKTSFRKRSIEDKFLGGRYLQDEEKNLERRAQRARNYQQDSYFQKPQHGMKILHMDTSTIHE